MLGHDVRTKPAPHVVDESLGKIMPDNPGDESPISNFYPTYVTLRSTAC